MDPIYFATLAVAFFSSILSGLAGGGGGFIMAPYWLVSGMSPAQGATTGAFMALGMGSSSLLAFKGTDHLITSKKLLATFLIMTLVLSVIGPFCLQYIHVDVFKPILGALTLASLPFLFISRDRLQFLHRNSFTGYALMAVLLLVSSFITSSAFSILMAVVLIQSFGLTTLQSTAIRRVIGIIQSAIIFLVLFSLGNFLFMHAVMAVVGGSLGSYMGTKISLKKGERFAKYALACSAIISAAALIA